MAARREALRVAARAIEQRLNADTSEHDGPTAACPRCARPARYAGRHPKTFDSALGTLTLERAYYHCQACQTGFCPRDAALGLKDSSLSPAVTRMVGLVGATVSFEEGHELLAELAGLRVPAKQVERAAEALGREISNDEKRVVERPPANESVAPTLYLGMDGAGVPIRKEELVGRPGKQPDGSSKTREVKLCTVWSAEGRDVEETPVRDEGSVSYSAAIESAAQKDTDEIPSEFAERVVREATRRAFERAPRRAVLGDGAKWIWNIASEHFPDAIQIVDRFHAKQHLSDAATSVDGPGSLGRQWAHQRYDELDAGDIDAILYALRVHSSQDEEARKCVEYIDGNRKRMRYEEFRAASLCTSTGVVEAGCNNAIGTRRKRPGMHWTVAGADAIAKRDRIRLPRHRPPPTLRRRPPPSRLLKTRQAAAGLCQEVWILCRFFPKASVVWIGLAIGCAITRVAAQSHFLSDLTVAAVAGMLVAEVVYRKFGTSASAVPR